MWTLKFIVQKYMLQLVHGNSKGRGGGAVGGSGYYYKRFFFVCSEGSSKPLNLEASYMSREGFRLF